MGSQRVRHDWVTFTSLHFINYKVLRWIIWGRKFSLKNKNLLLSKFGKAINKTLKKYSPVLEFSVEILYVIQFSSVQFSLSVMSDSLWPHGLYSPWYALGQNSGVGSLSLLQGIFPTQGLNPGLPHCWQILYQLSHKPLQFIVTKNNYFFNCIISLLSFN